MRLCVHRGTREIGGTCVEVEAAGDRIVLDLGLPLNAYEASKVALPDVAGFAAPDASLKAIVLSHGHRDHWGLVPRLRAPVPLVMGAATERIMRAAAPFVPNGFAPTAVAHLQDRNPLKIGAFTITPFLVDHSGFDAYAMVVEAASKRLFYSGDLRAHGKKAGLFERLVRLPPRDIDLMLMEGSSLGRIDDTAKFPSEDELEQVFAERFGATAGAVLIACSAQNIDRVVTIYRAARRTGRQLVVDAYAAEILKATGYHSIPKPADDWSDVTVFIPQAQRRSLVRKGIAHLVDAYKGRRIWPENLASHAARSVFLIRPWMLGELCERGVLGGARVIWSQWEGYLNNGSGADLRAKCKDCGLPFEVIHTSGHASPGDLKRLASAISPKRLVAIHTFERSRFPSLFDNVLAGEDWEWLSV